jgi:hypothetical protein
MKRYVLRCDNDDFDPKMLRHSQFTASAVRSFNPESTAHHFPAGIAPLHNMQLDRQDAAERKEAQQKKLQDAAQSR